MVGAEASRVYSISLPIDLATKAEAVAQSESRSLSDVVRIALSSYYERKKASEELFREIGEYAASRQCDLTEDDVDRVIHEFRAEEAAAKLAEAKR